VFITTEQRQDVDDLTEEFRQLAVTDPTGRTLLERAHELAQAAHGDPAVGRPVWAVRSEDVTEVVDPDQRTVMHNSCPASWPGDRR